MAGAPKANIDWEIVDELLISGCSGREIAGHIGISAHTIYDRCLSDHGLTFSEYSQQKYAKGESLLRDVQFKKALGFTKEGDNTMLVWLGKNRLGQKETHDAPQTAPNQDKIDQAAIILNQQNEIAQLKEKLNAIVQ